MAFLTRLLPHLQPDGTNSPAGASDLVPPERNTQDGLHAAPGSVEFKNAVKIVAAEFIAATTFIQRKHAVSKLPSPHAWSRFNDMIDGKVSDSAFDEAVELMLHRPVPSKRAAAEASGRDGAPEDGPAAAVAAAEDDAPDAPRAGKKQKTESTAGPDGGVFESAAAPGRFYVAPGDAPVPALDGVPHYMLARARLMLGKPQEGLDPAEHALEVLKFVFQNLDQPETFWMTSDIVEEVMAAEGNGGQRIVNNNPVKELQPSSCSGVSVKARWNKVRAVSKVIAALKSASAKPSKHLSELASEVVTNPVLFKEINRRLMANEASNEPLQLPDFIAGDTVDVDISLAASRQFDDGRPAGPVFTEGMKPCWVSATISHVSESMISVSLHESTLMELDEAYAEPLFSVPKQNTYFANTATSFTPLFYEICPPALANVAETLAGVWHSNCVQSASNFDVLVQSNCFSMEVYDRDGRLKVGAVEIYTLDVHHGVKMFFCQQTSTRMWVTSDVTTGPVRKIHWRNDRGEGFTWEAADSTDTAAMEVGVGAPPFLAPLATPTSGLCPKLAGCVVKPSGSVEERGDWHVRTHLKQGDLIEVKVAITRGFASPDESEFCQVGQPLPPLPQTDWVTGTVRRLDRFIGSSSLAEIEVSPDFQPDSATPNTVFTSASQLVIFGAGMSVMQFRQAIGSAQLATRRTESVKAFQSKLLCLAGMGFDTEEALSALILTKFSQEDALNLLLDDAERVRMHAEFRSGAYGDPVIPFVFNPLHTTHRTKFKQLDRDRNGKLSKDELQQGRMGDASHIAQMIADADTDGDGQISFDEFVTASETRSSWAPDPSTFCRDHVVQLVTERQTEHNGTNGVQTAAVLVSFEDEEKADLLKDVLASMSNSFTNNQPLRVMKATDLTPVKKITKLSTGPGCAATPRPAATAGPGISRPVPVHLSSDGVAVVLISTLNNLSSWDAAQKGLFSEDASLLLKQWVVKTPQMTQSGALSSPVSQYVHAVVKSDQQQGNRILLLDSLPEAADSVQPQAATLAHPTAVAARPWVQALTVCQSAHACVAKQGTHLRECLVCFTPLTAPQFASFCYRTFRITGDGAQIQNPRHPGSFCKDCLKQHCHSYLNEGRLFVPCPSEGCGRSLQTREMMDVVDAQVYQKLLVRMKEAEDQDDDDYDDIGLELRLCPACNVRIEKNSGCDSMNCYRCGTHFGWSTATKARSPDKSVSNAAEICAQLKSGSENEIEAGFDALQMLATTPKGAAACVSSGLTQACCSLLQGAYADASALALCAVAGLSSLEVCIPSVVEALASGNGAQEHLAAFLWINMQTNVSACNVAIEAGAIHIIVDLLPQLMHSEQQTLFLNILKVMLRHGTANKLADIRREPNNVPLSLVSCLISFESRSCLVAGVIVCLFDGIGDSDRVLLRSRFCAVGAIEALNNASRACSDKVAADQGEAVARLEDALLCVADMCGAMWEDAAAGSDLTSYFEVEVLKPAFLGFGVGLARHVLTVGTGMVGWDASSYGYHSDDGGIYAGSGACKLKIERFKAGDRVGCGFDASESTIYFTLNGNRMAPADIKVEPTPHFRLNPCITSLPDVGVSFRVTEPENLRGVAPSIILGGDMNADGQITFSGPPIPSADDAGLD